MPLEGDRIERPKNTDKDGKNERRRIRCPMPYRDSLIRCDNRCFVRDVGPLTSKNWSSLMTASELKALLGGKDQLRLSRLAAVGS